MNPVVVVAAVIERHKRILIAQRKAGARHPLKWEFPGGKVEPGEEPRAALARELREELGIEAVIGEQMEAYDFQYAGGRPTRLLFYRVTEFSGQPQNLEFRQIAWVRPDALPRYDFLEGDLRFIRRLAAGTPGESRPLHP